MGNLLTRCLSRDKKSLKISSCYSINPNNSQILFQQHVNNPSSILTFDASHVYWFPADLLCGYIVQMVHLEELSVQDTQITILHLARIFEACPKLVKLNFSLQEDNLDRYERDDFLEEALLSQGFSKLTHLKMYCHTLDKTRCVESWLVTFGVLKWCRDCKHLLIEVCHNSKHYAPLVVNKLKPHGLPKVRSQKVIKIAERELYLHLGWMRSLTSLVILKHDYGNSHPDLVLQNFSSWLLKEGTITSWPSIECLWIENKTRPDPRIVPKNFMNDPFFTSLMGKDFNKEQLRQGIYRFLQHTALAKLDEYMSADDLPALKYLRGSVTNVKWFQEFCQLHPLLEQLHLDDVSKDPGIFNGNWQLLALKVLVYEVYSPDPSQRVQHPFRRMFEAFPNIQELHLNLNLFEEDSPDFFANIQLKNLTSLTIENVSFPANYSLPTIDMRKCPQLQHLHLKGDFVPSHLFNHPEQQLPFATNLRDLRLEWDESKHGLHSGNASQFLFVLRHCRETLPKLERLVLVNSSGAVRNPAHSGLEALLVAFVEGMPDLVALCLVGFQIDRMAINAINRRLTGDIVPLRPALWFHVGQELPKTNERSVPKIHFDEIVNPLDKFHAPPHFF